MSRKRRRKLVVTLQSVYLRWFGHPPRSNPPGGLLLDGYPDTLGWVTPGWLIWARLLSHCCIYRTAASSSFPTPVAKRKLLGCLAHALAREAIFVLPSGLRGRSFGFFCSVGLPSGGGPDWVLEETRHLHMMIMSILITVHGNLSVRVRRIFRFHTSLSVRFLTILNSYHEYDNSYYRSWKPFLESS